MTNWGFAVWTFPICKVASIIHRAVRWVLKRGGGQIRFWAKRGGPNQVLSQKAQENERKYQFFSKKGRPLTARPCEVKHFNYFNLRDVDRLDSEFFSSEGLRWLHPSTWTVVTEVVELVEEFGRRIGRRIKSQLSKQRWHYQELGNVFFEQSILRPNQRPILRRVFLRPGVQMGKYRSR